MQTLLMTPPSQFRSVDGPSAFPTPSDARIAPLAASVAARLGAVCRDWDAAEFDALVHRIARTKLRWADAGYKD